MNNWYVTTTTNIADQGFIADEETGKDIAVVYDRKNAALVAAAPEMIALLKQIHEIIGEDLIDNVIDSKYRYYQGLIWRTLTQAEGGD